MKELLKLDNPPSKPLYKNMWAQISGMADCCSGGVIGRLGGQILHSTENVITEQDMKVCSTPYTTSATFKELILEKMSQNRAFAGPPAWLFWMVLEDVLNKYYNGIHTPKLKADNIEERTFDFEKNPYHKFWAGPGYRVKMWFLSDKVDIESNKYCRVNAFVNFIQKKNLGYILESKPIKASYSGEVTGMIFHPDATALRIRIPKELAIANKELVKRWAVLAPYTTESLKDKVAMKW